MAIAMASHVTRSEFKWVEKKIVGLRWIVLKGQLGIKYPKYIKMRDWLNIRLDELMCYLMNVSYLLSKRHEHTLGIPYHGYITVVGLNMDEHSNWLVVSTYPSEKIWLRQLGWLFPIYGKNVPNHQPNMDEHSTHAGLNHLKLGGKSNTYCPRPPPNCDRKRVATLNISDWIMHFVCDFGPQKYP